MSGDQEGRRPNDAAMADILASIRRIVADGADAPAADDPADEDVFELTPAMMVSGAVQPSSRPAAAPQQVEARMDRFARLTGQDATAGAEARGPAAAPPPAAPTPEVAASEAAAPEAPAPEVPASAMDEKAVADIVRRVLREEFSGAFGRSLTTQIRTLIEKEVQRRDGSPGP